MERVLSTTTFLLCLAAGIAGCAAPHEAIERRVEESRDSQAYGKYRNELARSNIELEKTGQTPVPVLNRDEWTRAEAARKEAEAGE